MRWKTWSFHARLRKNGETTSRLLGLPETYKEENDGHSGTDSTSTTSTFKLPDILRSYCAAKASQPLQFPADTHLADPVNSDSQISMASVPNTTNSVSSHPKDFSVAIVGGGIGGLSLALGLLKHPQIDLHIYESAPSFGEIGAGISIGPNAQRALELIGSEANGAFLKHATPNLWASHANNFAEYVTQDNELIYDQKNATGMQSVHRAHFLDELVKSVPAQRAHFNKRLVTLEDEPGKEVVLHFEDGTGATADAVIGADGIHSHVREHLLGKEAAKDVFAGSVVYRGLAPIDAAIEKLGAEYAQNCKMLCGPGRIILTYPIDHGAVLNMVAMDFDHTTWEHEKSIVPAKREELEHLFDGWGEMVMDIIDLLDTPDLACWKVCEAPVAPFYTKNRVAMMGDAAHATTPYQGQGAGQAIEDALVLTSVLARVSSPGQIPNAFAAFDQVRRPRSQRVVTTSREAGALNAMREKEVGTDIGKMREKLSKRMHWIWHRDMLAQNKEAVDLFEESL